MSQTSQPDKACAAQLRSGEMVVRAGWLLDGQGGVPLVDQWITIGKGRIVSVAPALGKALLSKNALDFSQATILPALMDAHVHLALSGTSVPELRKAQLETTPRLAKLHIKKHLGCYRQWGVVAVRDAGDRQGVVLQVKQQARMPRVAATCWAWHRAGRYGGMIGRSLNPNRIQGDDFAASLKGADHIKLIQSGLNNLDCYGLQTPPQFSAGQLEAVARVARRFKLPMMVHANGEEPVAMALEAGCHSIEHGYFMGPDNLTRMADRHIFWVPTATPMAALTRQESVSIAQADVAAKTLEHQLTQIDLAHQLGVPMALGTDAGAIGVDHGVAVAQELRMLITAGLSVSQAVRCASLHTAELMGLKKRGALRQGWRADLIAVPGPPDDLPESLNRIEGICIEGEWI